MAVRLGIGTNLLLKVISMASILITGSADGLGQLSAKALADQGHHVVLHARTAERGRYAQQHVPRAEHVIAGDLSDIDATKNVAYEANALGRFDAVIHNAGVYQAPPQDMFMVNTLAPLHSYLFDTQTQALDLPELKHASPGACKLGKRQHGHSSHTVCRFKVVCGDAVYGRSTHMVRCVRERRRSRLGPYKNGWAWCTG